ncbi:hypothetical protein [Hyphobacterium marinum]|uniref:Tetratricopeptide repeat protein n=1 Tax=Hyphobacterium marinum TaxID=3116574 RepID=A0ABU7LWJ5_9PROT|nr:hypothetical protein [Hyphobacterium sp. Y6023]MEE2565912.1 hypothetical protein [Hyphobacterium sp. Y6023]
MRLLTGLIAALALAAQAGAIPGVTIPFPDEAEDVADDSGEDATESGETDESGEGASADGDGQETADVAVEQTRIATPEILAGPHLTAAEYPAREIEDGQVARLIWSVRREEMDGTDIDGESERVVTLGPDFAFDPGGDAPILYDFAHNRRIALDLEARTMRNESFYGEIRQRLDTYFGLSQGGTLDDIPFGPEQSFDRFWLEAAMGLRRTPVTLSRETSNGMERVSRDGVVVFAFVTPDAAEAAEDAASEVVLELEPAGDAESGTDGDDTPEAEDDPLLDLLRGDDSEEDTDADTETTETAAVDDTDMPGPVSATTDTPEAAALEAHMPVFRRWMRHALPLHPDALSAMDGLDTIPARFELVVVSPASPDGRREIWTLERIEDAPATFPLPEDLSAEFGGRAVITARVVPAFEQALASADTDHTAAIVAEAEAYLDAGNYPAAYLAAYQESAHSTACSPQTTERPSCAIASRIVSAGLGNAEFEGFFDGIAAIATSRHAAAYEGVAPYLDMGGYAGAAANIIAANEVIAWTASGGEPPEDADPFAMLATALENDPAAPAAYWHLGQLLLTTGDRRAAWSLFDLGRVIDEDPFQPLLAQTYILEDRLRGLAPDFFLPLD